MCARVGSIARRRISSRPAAKMPGRWLNNRPTSAMNGEARGAGDRRFPTGSSLDRDAGAHATSSPWSPWPALAAASPADRRAERGRRRTPADPKRAADLRRANRRRRDAHPLRRRHDRRRSTSRSSPCPIPTGSSSTCRRCASASARTRARRAGACSRPSATARSRRASRASCSTSPGPVKVDKAFVVPPADNQPARLVIDVVGTTPRGLPRGRARVSRRAECRGIGAGATARSCAAGRRRFGPVHRRSSIPATAASTPAPRA